MVSTYSLRESISQKKGKKLVYKKQLKKARQDLKKYKRQMIVHDKAIEISKQVGIKTQKEIEFHFADQVSLTLASIFPDPYKLKIEFAEKRGKPEANLLYTRRSLETQPLGATGGGSIDVGAFALRVAYLTMRQDKKIRPVLILDEPFKGLKGKEANKLVLDLLNTISHELKIQIIMISDERIPREDIIEYADRVFIVKQKKGISSVIEK